MEPECLLQSSHEPATGSYPEPDASTPHLPICFPEIRSNIVLHKEHYEIQTVWDVGGCSASHEIPRLLCNPKIYERLHKYQWALIWTSSFKSI
jgi:hypothetical protein